MASFSGAARYTSAALTSDGALLFGAGFAPFVAKYLSSRIGLIVAGGYLHSGAFVTLAALWLNKDLGARTCPVPVPWRECACRGRFFRNG